MRYFSALCARMYRLSANSRATISSTAIFLSQQSRQYFSSPLGSETSLAPQSGQRDSAAARFDIRPSYRVAPAVRIASPRAGRKAVTAQDFAPPGRRPRDAAGAKRRAGAREAPGIDSATP